MQPSSRAYLEDIIERGSRALSYVSEITFQEYVRDLRTKDAVERNLFVVGEAVVQLRSTDPETAALLTDIAAIASFRNIMAHGYSIVDDEIVWGILIDWLPILIRQAKSMLHS